jgi:hypothetical protein
MSESTLETMRRLCLSHAGAFEKQSHGMPAFFIEKSGQFATYWDNHHGDGILALFVAMPPGMQEALVESDPDIYYRPPYYGPSGWVGIRLDNEPNWTEIEGLVAEAHAFVAAKRSRK